jgi:hypothetical protein
LVRWLTSIAAASAGAGLGGRVGLEDDPDITLDQDCQGDGTIRAIF